MKIYQIYRRGQFCSGGFCESFDESTDLIFSSKEKAVKNLPKDELYSYGGNTEYYIREREIE